MIWSRLARILPHPLECWDYRHPPLHWAHSGCLNPMRTIDTCFIRQLTKLDLVCKFPSFLKSHLLEEVVAGALLPWQFSSTITWVPGVELGLSIFYPWSHPVVCKFNEHSVGCGFDVNSNFKAFLEQYFGRRKEPVAGEMGRQNREMRVNMSKAHDGHAWKHSNETHHFVTFFFQGGEAHVWKSGGYLRMLVLFFHHVGRDWPLVNRL